MPPRAAGGAGRGRPAADAPGGRQGPAARRRGARAAPVAYRIAHNTSLNQLRKSGYDFDELQDSLRITDAAEDELERRAVVRQTLAGLADLPERQRAALLAIAVEGRSQDEVAEELGLSQGAVRQLVHRARTQLRAAATAITPFPLVAWIAAASTRAEPMASARRGDERGRRRRGRGGGAGQGRDRARDRRRRRRRAGDRRERHDDAAKPRRRACRRSSRRGAGLAGQRARQRTGDPCRRRSRLGPAALGRIEDGSLPPRPRGRLVRQGLRRGRPLLVRQGLGRIGRRLVRLRVLRVVWVRLGDSGSDDHSGSGSSGSWLVGLGFLRLRLVGLGLVRVGRALRGRARRAAAGGSTTGLRLVGSTALRGRPARPPRRPRHRRRLRRRRPAVRVLGLLGLPGSSGSGSSGGGSDDSGVVGPRRRRRLTPRVTHGQQPVSQEHEPVQLSRRSRSRSHAPARPGHGEDRNHAEGTLGRARELADRDHPLDREPGAIRDRVRDLHDRLRCAACHAAWAA